MGHRPERVAELIHKELAQRLRLEVKDPRVTDVSITHVKVSADLSYATISYMPLGGGEPSEELAEGMQSASRQLRGPIGRALRLRHAPELRFVYDTHTDRAVEMSTLLDRLARERAEREGDPS
jgi:ribosome-binding factor A